GGAMGRGAAGRRAIAGQLARSAELPPLAYVIAVDLLEHLLGVDLIRRRRCAVAPVLPCEMSDRGVPRVPRVAVQRLQASAEVVHEPGVGPAVTWRRHSPVVPLEHALGVREGAVFLDHRGGGQEADLGRDGLRIY